MDSKDKEIKSKNIGLSKGLIEFYNNIDPLFLPYIKYDFVGNLYNGYAKVRFNDKWNFIDIQGKLVFPNQWFDGVGIFTNGYAWVKLNSKFNFIDTRGKLLSPNLWFNAADDFYDGSALVKLNNKWYKIDTKGNIMTAVNEHTVTITKSDIKNMIMECVKKIMNIS